MSRARRIAQYLHDNRTGIGIAKIRDAVDKEATFGTIGAQLAQLIEAGKVRRTGAGRNTLFFPTAEVLVDNRATKPRKNLKIVATPAKAKAKRYASPKARAPTLAQQPVVVARKASRVKPRIASVDAKPETVEEFLARGGRIQHCAPGERGFEPESYQQQSLAHKERVRSEVIAKNKAKPRNQSAQNDDVDLDYVA